jgi:hypothetical protein
VSGEPAASGPPTPVRASDADRERFAERLRDDYAAGRLTLDELMARTDEVHRATTVAELQGTLRGLPGPPAPASGPPAVRRSGKATASMVLGILGLVLPSAFVLPSLAVVLGLAARGEIARDAGLEGASNARAGIALGAIALVVHVAVLVGLLAGGVF